MNLHIKGGVAGLLQSLSCFGASGSGVGGSLFGMAWVAVSFLLRYGCLLLRRLHSFHDLVGYVSFA